ncbi:hypothetical protein EDB85DRAFT_2274732 [Lactarius pseudohatsudake]|nr:hypothetical protein EDB85DRAFT_2274732 [Lactarius pseudohatsudake]
MEENDVLCSVKAPVIRDMASVAVCSCAESLVTSHWVLKTDSPSPIGTIHATLGINKPLSSQPCPHRPQPRLSLLLITSLSNCGIKMMFMRTILALSLAAFAFAVPVGEAAGNQVRRGPDGPGKTVAGLTGNVGGLGLTLAGLTGNVGGLLNHGGGGGKRGLPVIEA